MKLTVMGGGGVRSPLFAITAIRHAGQIGLDELCLMDIDAEKLRIFGGLSQALSNSLASPLKVTCTTDARQALEDASYVVTTLRVGGDAGRIQDERIAIQNGVLGQETTGAGGFAMALRSVPAILGYARMLAQINPQAWIFNFTNPAGLVTQALRDAGFERTIGICDSANAAQHAAGRWLGGDQHQLTAEVFGLNHLSWARRVLLDGKDVLPELLADPRFLAETMLRLFDPELVRETGMWLNEYLYYYYYPEKALAHITQASMTRGEEVAMLNQQLIEQMQTLDQDSDPDAALATYFAYEQRRSSTYMPYDRAAPAESHPTGSPAQDWLEKPAGEEGEGYAGLAFNLIQALQSEKPLVTGLNVPNQGAIDGLPPTDVVEVTCQVNRTGVLPVRMGAIPEGPELLMRCVKRYERLAVAAIRDKSRRTAVQALMAHPLVQSYARATTLVDQYLKAHAQYVGEWVA